MEIRSLADEVMTGPDPDEAIERIISILDYALSASAPEPKAKDPASAANPSNP
jgi:hypothetical protein